MEKQIFCYCWASLELDEGWIGKVKQNLHFVKRLEWKCKTFIHRVELSNLEFLVVLLKSVNEKLSKTESDQRSGNQENYKNS